MSEVEYLIEIYQTNAWAPRAFMAATLVGIMCGALGAFIVLRNMSLIGDALSHAVLPGVVFSYLLVYAVGQIYICGDMSPLACENILDDWLSTAFFLGSVLAALLSSVLITWIQRNVRTENDAAIGIVFTTMFSIGVIGISAQKSVHLDLQDMLFGNVLGVSDTDLWITFIVALFVVGSIIVFYRQLFATTFQPIVAETMGIKTNAIHYLLMLILSFAVVASMRTVGVILVVAMLVTPAATALLLANKLKQVILLSSLIGFLAAAVGMNISIIGINTSFMGVEIILSPPPGPTIVITSTLLYLLAVVFSPNRGLISRYLNRKKMLTPN